MSSPSLPVLAVEDEESDAFILQLAFKRVGLPNPLTVLRDGQEAVDYLSGAGPYGDRSLHPLPGLLLLDLKMPRMTGFDVLAWLGTQLELKDLPVIVLSSSSDESDIAKARQLGARDYFVKPHGIAEFGQILESLGSRWLKDSSG